MRVGIATFKIRVTKKRALVINRKKLARLQELRDMEQPMSIQDERDRPRGRRTGQRTDSPAEPQEESTTTYSYSSSSEEEGG